MKDRKISFKNYKNFRTAYKSLLNSGWIVQESYETNTFYIVTCRK